MTDRQAEFCKLLIDLARQIGSSRLPVIFNSDHGKLIMDKGCIKIAEHQGFIRPLKNDTTGLVSFIELNFKVDGALG